MAALVIVGAVALINTGRAKAANPKSRMTPAPAPGDD
jgi:hypothetical protein